MRILLKIGIGLAAFAALVLLAGVLLPREHVAGIQAHYRAPADSIHALIIDVAAGPGWRSGLERVEILSAGEPVRWREHSDWGTLTFVRDENAPGRIVHRIVDEGQGFGGTWTFELDAARTGTTLRITEHGSVSNPLYRVMSRLMGHHTGVETYAKDLARRLGEEVELGRR